MTFGENYDDVTWLFLADFGREGHDEGEKKEGDESFISCQPNM